MTPNAAPTQPRRLHSLWDARTQQAYYEPQSWVQGSVPECF